MRARGADGPFSSKALMKATSFDHSVSCRREDLSHMRCVVAATSYSNQLPQLTLRLNGPYGSMSGLISSKLPLHAYNQQIPSKRIICAIPLQQSPLHLLCQVPLCKQLASLDACITVSPPTNAASTNKTMHGMDKTGKGAQAWDTRTHQKEWQIIAGA